MEDILETINNTPNDSELGSKLRELFNNNDITNIDYKDSYIRLLAEFDNYKKRTKLNIENEKDNAKLSIISSILDLDNDLSIAYKSLDENLDKTGINLIIDKFDKFIKSNGIEEIQTDKYDSDIHEVVTIVETGKESILNVVSKGYKINDKVIRYPKVILSK